MRNWLLKAEICIYNASGQPNDPDEPEPEPGGKKELPALTPDRKLLSGRQCLGSPTWCLLLRHFHLLRPHRVGFLRVACLFK